MAEKEISLAFGSTEAKVIIEGAIEREALYGKQSPSIEKDGVALEKIILAPWGEILSPKAFKTIGVDSEGSLTKKPIASDESGNPVPIHTSSFKETRELKKAQWEELASFRAEAVMPATTDLPEGLYKTSFTFRDSSNLKDAFLLVREDGAFLLAGELRNSPLRGKEETYDFFETEAEGDEEEDEMGFDTL